MRDADLHRADRAADRAGRHQEHREHGPDDQSVGALQTVVRQRVGEYQAEDRRVERQRPAALAPQCERGREGLETGHTNHGIWSAGQVQGLIQDVPTVKVLVDRIVAETEAIVRE